MNTLELYSVYINFNLIGLPNLEFETMVKQTHVPLVLAGILLKAGTVYDS